jgi:hypothetical protein
MENNKCIHGIQRNGYKCKICGIGRGICIHKRQQRLCIECNGSSICEHQKDKYYCKICGIGRGICIHNKRKYNCKQCDGLGICIHKRGKSQCIECNGSSICEHKRQQRLCIECNGSSICEHKRQRHQCLDCKRGLPLQEALTRYKDICVICTRKLRTLKSKEAKLCGECNKDNPKRIEHYWREYIIRYMEFESSHIDQQICVQNCREIKYRPDLVFLTDKVAIIYECDEESHRDYIESCELARLDSLKDGFPNHKLLVIRLNPHGSKSTPKELKSLESKCYFSVRLYKRILNELLDDVVNVCYICYDEEGYKHINNARQSKDNINVLHTLHCDN